MAELSKASVLHCVQEVKRMVHDEDLSGANDKLDDMILQLTDAKYICVRCGKVMTAEMYHMGGEYCELCCKEYCEE